MLQLIRKWLQPAHSVCIECGVHFEPLTGYEARWGHLCKEHRKAVMELDRRRDKVMAWATLHWEELEKRALKDEIEQREAYNRSFGNAMNNMMAAQSAACQNPGYMNKIRTGANFFSGGKW